MVAAAPPGPDVIGPTRHHRVPGCQSRERYGVVTAAARTGQYAEHRNVRAPRDAVSSVGQRGPRCGGYTRDSGAVGEPDPRLVERARKKFLGHVLPGEHRVVPIDPAVDEAYGHPGAGLRVLTLQKVEVAVGDTRPDVAQPPLRLEVLVPPVVAREILSEGRENLRQDTVAPVDRYALRGWRRYGRFRRWRGRLRWWYGRLRRWCRRLRWWCGRLRWWCGRLRWWCGRLRCLLPRFHSRTPAPASTEREQHGKNYGTNESRTRHQYSNALPDLCVLRNEQAVKGAWWVSRPSFPRNRLCQNPIRERRRPPKSSFPRKRESRRGGVGKRRVGTPPGPLESRFRGNDGGGGNDGLAFRAPKLGF